MLAQLYQDDIVDEDDIRQWHVTPAARGEGLKPGALLDGVKYGWVVGQKLIEQFDAQESDDESDEDDEDLLDLEFHPSYCVQSDKRKKKWEKKWEALVKAVSVHADSLIPSSDLINSSKSLID